MWRGSPYAILFQAKSKFSPGRRRGLIQQTRTNSITNYSLRIARGVRVTLGYNAVDAAVGPGVPYLFSIRRLVPKNETTEITSSPGDLSKRRKSQSSYYHIMHPFVGAKSRHCRSLSNWHWSISVIGAIHLAAIVSLSNQASNR